MFGEISSDLPLTRVDHDNSKQQRMKRGRVCRSGPVGLERAWVYFYIVLLKLGDVEADEDEAVN